MAMRTWILLFSITTLVAGNGCCCWHHWGHCCRYNDPPGPRVVVEPAPRFVPLPQGQVP